MECAKCGAEIENCLVVCSKCSDSLKKEKKIYRLFKLSTICLLIFFIAFTLILLALEKNKISDFAWIYISAFTLTTLAASPILAIIFLLKINFHKDSLGIGNYAFVIIFLSAIIMLPVGLMSGNTRHRSVAYRMVCGTNLNKLGKALLLYANDNNGQLPEAYWCDQLITDGYVSPEDFICDKSGAKLCESSFALNKEVAGKNISDIPPDMVVLFESTLGVTKSGRDFPAKDREFNVHEDYEISRFAKVYKDQWNQVGGPESLAVDNHQGDGCNILFGDMHVRFEKEPWSSDLKWSLREDYVFKLPQFTQPDPEKIEPLLLFKKVSISVIAIIIVGGAFYSLHRFQFRKYRSFTILLGFTCVLLGFVLGGFTETLYSSNDIFGVGAIAGVVGGLIVGICYFAILTKRFYSMKHRKRFMSYAVSLGMAAGMICSTILHLVLMIMAEEKMPFGLITGLSVGIIVGAIMGAISGAECEKELYDNGQNK